MHNAFAGVDSTFTSVLACGAHFSAHKHLAKRMKDNIIFIFRFLDQVWDFWNPLLVPFALHWQNLEVERIILHSVVHGMSYILALQRLSLNDICYRVLQTLASFLWVSGRFHLGFLQGII